MQCFTVWCDHVERRDLVAEEAPLFGYIDVLEPCQGHSVKIYDMILKGPYREESQKCEVQAGACCEGDSNRLEQPQNPRGVKHLVLHALTLKDQLRTQSSCDHCENAVTLRVCPTKPHSQ